MHYKSKVDILYEKILDGIISGTYKQGDRLVISKLAKDNRVSDIPVREALRRIESEGFIKIIANHGAVVTEYDPSEIAQIYLINAVIGGFATKISADFLSETTLLELSRINRELKKAVEEDDYNKYLLYDESFHVRIFSAAPYPLVYKSINKTWINRIDKQFKHSKERQHACVEEHNRILEIVQEKDYNTLETITRDHLIAPIENLLQEINEFPIVK